MFDTFDTFHWAVTYPFPPPISVFMKSFFDYVEECGLILPHNFLGGGNYTIYTYDAHFEFNVAIRFKARLPNQSDTFIAQTEFLINRMQENSTYK